MRLGKLRWAALGMLVSFEAVTVFALGHVWLAAMMTLAAAVCVYYVAANELA